jgi:hypothetical protein
MLDKDLAVGGQMSRDWWGCIKYQAFACAGSARKVGMAARLPRQRKTAQAVVRIRCLGVRQNVRNFVTSRCCQ